MKYMTKGGFQSHPLMRLTLGLTLLLLAGFWLTNAALYLSKMSLSPESVVLYYYGSEDQFIAPRSYASMLEVTHGHLAMMAMVLLFLTHLVIFVPAPRSAKVGFIVLTFFSALGGEAAGWLVRFFSPQFAVMKVACFVLLQTCMAALILALAAYLIRESVQDRRGQAALAGVPARSRPSRRPRHRGDRERAGLPWKDADAAAPDAEDEAPDQEVETVQPRQDLG